MSESNAKHFAVGDHVNLEHVKGLWKIVALPTNELPYQLRRVDVDRIAPDVWFGENYLRRGEFAHVPNGGEG